MNKPLIALLFCSLWIGACEEAEVNVPRFWWSDERVLDKPYDQVCFLMTHNSYNSPPYHIAPNQDTFITQQLRDGVRGLMIDVYDGSPDPLVYHINGPIFGQEKLGDILLEIRQFLDNYPKAVISIIFENHCTNAALQNAIIDLELDDLAYVHDGTWPTMQEMVDSNTRLVMFVENNYPAQSREPWLHYAWSTVFDNPYTYSNPSQFSTAVNRGGSGTRQLYLVNHWLSGGLGLPDRTLADDANNRATLSKHIQDCAAANSHFVNFVGIDFYNIGDAGAVIDSINGN